MECSRRKAGTALAFPECWGEGELSGGSDSCRARLPCLSQVADDPQTRCKAPGSTARALQASPLLLRDAASLRIRPGTHSQLGCREASRCSSCLPSRPKLTFHPHLVEPFRQPHKKVPVCTLPKRSRERESNLTGLRCREPGRDRRHGENGESQRNWLIQPGEHRRVCSGS